MIRFFLLSILILTIMGCDFNSEPPIRVGHISWPGYELLSLAHSRELYKNIDVEIIRPSNNAEILLAFKHNVIDVAAVTLNHALELQSDSEESISIIAVLDISHGADTIIAHDSIKSIADLKGKRLGMEPSLLGAYFTSRAIDSSPNISLSQIHILPLSIDSHMEHFLNNNVDAIVTYEPVKSRILLKKGHVLFDSSQIPNEIIDVLIVKTSFAENNVQTLTELLNGYFKALALAAKQPVSTFIEMAEFEKIEVNDYKKAFSGIHIPDREENIKFLGDANSAILTAKKKLQIFMTNNHLIKNDKKSALNFTSKFLLNSSRK